MNNRIYFMDSLRGFTILLVVIFHLTLLYTECI
jgi:surface polysaccharide O-acyltransferase-like enzyme